MSNPDRKSVVELLAQLVSINSVNPALVSGGAGEFEIAQFVVDWLRHRKIDAELQGDANRPNAVARLTGRGRGRSLMLNAHMDTVGFGGMDSPLELRVDGDRAYGRGAYDMKGSLAAIMLAGVELAAMPVAGDVVIAAVADEEHMSFGTQALLEWVKTDGAIITEPTGLEICVAHKGFAWTSIETRGRAAHGSKPDLGVDAIAAMGPIIVGLGELNKALSSGPGHSLLGHGSLHCSLIEGGQELSSYPAKCRLQVERRTVPGETRDDVVSEIEGVLTAARAAEPQLEASAETMTWRDAFQAELDSPVVSGLVDSVTRNRGREPRIYGDTPWMDAAFTQSAGISSVVFGPGGEGAHSDEEWVSLSDIASCIRIIVDFAGWYCA